MAQENDTKNLDISDNEFTQGQESAKDIPNAQVGEAISGSHGEAGMHEQLGDVGNRERTPYDAERREETEKAVEGE